MATEAVKTQHTPGPWELDDVGGAALGVFGPDLNAIAYFSWGNQPLERDPNETLANARLIAAAPELYEACKAAIGEIDMTARLLPKDDDFIADNVEAYEALERAQEALIAAIAKAEGQS